jgi:hypothetical protein
VEGSAAIDGRSIGARDVGSAVVDQNQVLSTSQGKAEVLLTPGVFLRLDNNSQLRMASTGLTNTSVELVRGEALVEADALFKDSHITILEHGSTTTLVKNGLYSFNADLARVATYEGEAKVQEDDRSVTVKKGHQVNVGAPLRVAKFDRNEVDDLYHWSSVRSQYVSEANVSAARTYVVSPGLWAGPGWYWDPYFSAYSFIPGAGFLYSPFGWGFYSPYAVYGVGFYRGGYYGRGFYGGRTVVAPPARGVFRGGLGVTPLHSNAFAGSGFRGGFSGGGFHGGGGGRR